MAENVSLQVGGTSGIGLSTVKLFLKRGVSVVVADIDEGRGTAVERDLTSRGYTVTFVKASVTDDDSLNNMIAKAASIYGKIDFAVNTPRAKEARFGPKWVWAIITLMSFPSGGILYMLIGRDWDR